MKKIGLLFSVAKKLVLMPVKWFRFVGKLHRFFGEFSRFKSLGGFGGGFCEGPLFPCLEDAADDAGVAVGDYFNQDLYVAQRIFENKPFRHVDIGSRVDGFVAHVATFREIEVLDIRPLASSISNIKFRQCDFMGEIPIELVGAFDSVSSLHAIEHFGLGRYGDTLDPEGWRKGLENLGRLLKPTGRLYFSVPIGPMRIEFNAHRVFSVKFLCDYFREIYDIESFSYVDDAGLMHPNVTLEGNSGLINEFGCTYGCGIFVLIKKN